MYSQWRITTGDCLDILPTIPDNSVDLVFTDPPYNVGKDYGLYKDDLPLDEYVFKMQHVIRHCRRISNNNIAFYVGGNLTKLYWELIPDAHMIVVHKRAIGVMSGNFFLQYHSLFVTGKPVKKTKDLWDDIRLPGEGYFYRDKRYGHPGETSLPLTARVVTHFSNKGDTVFDPYIGTGTTIIACLQNDRKSIGIELNPDYVKIAEGRINEQLMQTRLSL